MESHHDQQPIKLKQQQQDQEEDQDEEEEEEYIDMEVSSFTQLLHPMAHHTPTNTTFISSPQEFEFPPNNAEEKDSPADELFYKGKLLPLLLPSRVLTIQNLHTSSSSPLTQQQLFPNEYFPHCFPKQDTQHVDIGGIKKSWGKKFRAKIKGLFGKQLVAGCSVQSSVLVKGTQKNPGNFCHRRSFSDAFKCRSSTKNLSSLSSSSSSSSSSSRSGNEVDVFKRSSSANMEMEMEGSLIQGAIAHCKKSQQ